MRAENIPVKISGANVGKANIDDDGTIHIVMAEYVSQELLDSIVKGFTYGLSIAPIINPAVDGKLISRVDHEKPLVEFGGFNPQIATDGNTYFHH